MKKTTPFFLSLLLLFTHLSVHAQLDTARVFMFGHSLMDHRPPLIPTPSDETTIAHWISILADAASNEYSATGEFGFLGSHAANLPPDSQWGYDTVATPWDASVTPITQANLDQILMTPLNYVQWQGPHLPYFGSTDSPLSAAQTLIDYCNTQLPDSPRIYIYENWPDMSQFLGGGSFPPNATQFANFHSDAIGGHHTWFLGFQDSLVARRPATAIKMIPVGPAISQLLTQAPYNTIPVTELYEDDAPHGRASIYFLAGLITYMAIFEEKAPPTYTPPTIVHATIRNNYISLVDVLWAELQQFNYANGNSRVFFGTNLIPLAIGEETKPKLDTPSPLSWNIYPNPSQNGQIHIQLESDQIYAVDIYDLEGRMIDITKSLLHLTVNTHVVSGLTPGMYVVRVQGREGVYVDKVRVD